MEEIIEEELRERVLNALETRNSKELIEIFETIPNIDIAEAIEDVDDVKMLLYIFKVVSSEYTA